MNNTEFWIFRIILEYALQLALNKNSTTIAQNPIWCSLSCSQLFEVLADSSNRSTNYSTSKLPQEIYVYKSCIKYLTVEETDKMSFHSKWMYYHIIEDSAFFLCPERRSVCQWLYRNRSGTYSVIHFLGIPTSNPQDFKSRQEVNFLKIKNAFPVLLTIYAESFQYPSSARRKKKII